MSKKVIQTNKAPDAVGPYSQAVVANGFIYTAGQIPLVPVIMQLIEGGIEIQTRQVMENITTVLAASGSSLTKVVKTTVFLQDMNDFAAFNKIYEEYFPENPPARSTVQVAKLPLGALIEIEAIATVD